VFARLLYQSFRRQQRRKLLAAVAIMLGVGVATAMIAIGVDVGDKMNRELRKFGANLVLTPENETLEVNIAGATIVPAGRPAYLKESELPRMKGIFWGHNILAYAPVLNATAHINGRAIPVMGTYFAREEHFGKETFLTGVRQTNPWWQVQGVWPKDDGNEVLVGAQLASALNAHPGDQLTLDGTAVRISGLVSGGGPEESSVVTPLQIAQKLAGAPGGVERVFVSALTKPEDDFARKDPDKLSRAQRDRWYCSPYANSIAYQLREAFPGSHAEQIRQVAQNEGRVLSRISGLMFLVTIAALTAAALAVSAAMATAVLERRHEVGLMKSLGATAGAIGAIFFSEAAVIALGAGLAGFGIGIVLAKRLGESIFHTDVAISPVLLPLVLAIAVLVTFAGSAISIRRAIAFNPAVVLRGDA
jgi:putative ABC transport system permease protein